MTQGEEIIRVAAKGDGVTASGRHVALAAPGDVVLPDGSVQPGTHHAAPSCRHFGTCGGCQLQHLDEAALARFVADRVLHAARAQDLEPEMFATPHLFTLTAKGKVQNAVLQSETKTGWLYDERDREDFLGT